MSTITTKMINIIHKTKETNPLIHCLTNHITINDCANIILAVGGKPIMAEHVEEVGNITKNAKALVINIGNINDARIDAIFLSGKIASKNNIPIIFDPVGVAGSPFRKDLSKKILQELKPNIIRGNISEIKALSNITTKATGIDIHPSDVPTDKNIDQLTDIVKELSVKQDAVIVATGKTDIIADHHSLYLVSNGVDMLSQITGTGCMCTSLIAAYCSHGDLLTASVAATTIMGVCGELAKENSNGIGSFKISLFDHLYQVSNQMIQERGKIIEVH
ncbi:MAG: hydroxyethylthiazole kinase [Epulopiscium sp.]|nr:hydroxyethylthiazole kinase [Candidatus Epulonipiscium sp.]